MSFQSPMLSQPHYQGITYIDTPADHCEQVDVFSSHPNLFFERTTPPNPVDDGLSYGVQDGEGVISSQACSWTPGGPALINYSIPQESKQHPLSQTPYNSMLQLRPAEEPIPIPSLGETSPNPSLAPEPSHGTARRGPAKSAKLPSSSVDVLEAWLKKHTHHPYPSKEDKHSLSKASGLTMKQIDTWFVNTRKRRQLGHNLQSNVLKAKVASILDSSERPTEALIPAFCVEPSPHTPAATSSTQDCFPEGSDAHGLDPNCLMLPTASRQRSMSVGSIYSVDPLPPSTSCSSSSRNQNGLSRSLSDSKCRITYQCTFCGKLLSEKTWKRHETSTHEPDVKWVCMPQGTSIIPAMDSEGRYQFKCTFCGVIGVSESHNDVCTHKITECLRSPLDKRAFFRKDHLKQHFEQFHKATLDGATADLWSSEVNWQGRTWLCGFCGKNFANWKLRCSHIADHFRDGYTIGDHWRFVTRTEQKPISLLPTTSVGPTLSAPAGGLGGPALDTQINERRPWNAGPQHANHYRTHSAPLIISTYNRDHLIGSEVYHANRGQLSLHPFGDQANGALGTNPTYNDLPGSYSQLGQFSLAYRNV